MPAAIRRINKINATAFESGVIVLSTLFFSAIKEV
jgi:hypothetical protein